MDRTAFMTLGRQQHRFGRLSVIFDVDPKSKTLFASVLAGRELLQGMSFAADLSYHLRVFMLPNQDLAAVEEVLLRPRKRLHSSTYKKYSSNHTATQTPILDEEFQFPLSDVILAPQDFSIYMTIVANKVVASDGTGFAGCMAFPLLEILRRHDDMPRWFWLLPKRSGLTHFESVQHHLLPAAAEATPDVTLYGRSESLANAFINGDYLWQPEMHDGHSVYRMRKRNLVLFFHGPRGAWAIADQIGSSAPFAYADDTANYPAEITQPWCVFSKTREFRREQGHVAPGRFEVDPNVHIALAGEAATARQPSAYLPRTAALPRSPPQALLQAAPAFAVPPPPSAFAPPTSTHEPTAAPAAPHSPLPSRPPQAQGLRSARPQLASERREGFERLMDAHEGTVAAFELLAAMAESAASDLPENTFELLFEQVPDMHIAAKQMMAILVDLVRRDPELKSNIGAGLRHAANLIEAPLLPFAATLPAATMAARQLPQTVVTRLAGVAAARGSNHTVTSALAAAAATIAPYPPLLRRLLDVTPTQYPDHGTLSEALSIFTDLARRMSASHSPTTSVVYPNPLANLPIVNVDDLSEADGGGRPVQRRLEQDGRVSPYALVEESASRRMSLAPDVEQDEDQLPVVDGARDRQDGGDSPVQAVARPDPVPAARSITPPTTSGDPTWMHGDLPKSGAEELLKEGVPLNGRFLVRNRAGKSGEYVLTLTYKQQSTHHLLDTNADGFITINRRKYGDHRTLAAALQALAQPDVPGWPQPLVDFVPRSGADPASIAADRRAFGFAT